MDEQVLRRLQELNINPEGITLQTRRRDGDHCNLVMRQTLNGQDRIIKAPYFATSRLASRAIVREYQSIGRLLAFETLFSPTRIPKPIQRQYNGYLDIKTEYEYVSSVGLNRVLTKTMSPDLWQQTFNQVGDFLIHLGSLQSPQFSTRHFRRLIIEAPLRQLGLFFSVKVS